MGSRSVSLGSSRRLGVLLLALVALPAVALAWLGLRLLDQDRVLVAQRALERREVALQAAARDISQSLADAERASAGGAVPPGAVRFTVSPTGITAEPLGAVLWQPVPSTYPEAASQPFLEAERSEFLGALDRARANWATSLV